MTSDPSTVFVWVWLPGSTTPVVCGRLDATPSSTRSSLHTTFTYGRSYRERPDAIPLFAPELPIVAGPQDPADAASELPLAIADSLPDAWGRRVIHYRDDTIGADHSDLHYLLAASSDRIGALGFSTSPDEPPPPAPAPATLDDLREAASRIERGEPLPDDLSDALRHGTSIGGARPKAVLHDRGKPLIAKFSSSSDTYPVIKTEYAAMTLAAHAGIETAPVELVDADGRACLLVERFDRTATGERRHLVSSLTVLGLAVYPSSRFASYATLADRIRASFDEPESTLRELFTRIAFNILVGNTDDHGKNHAAFVGSDGQPRSLTPAYDICPQPRMGSRASLAMPYGPGGESRTRVASLIEAAGVYHLDRGTAADIVDRLVATIRDRWDEVCDDAGLSDLERDALLGNQFLHPDVFEPG